MQLKLLITFIFIILISQITFAQDFNLNEYGNFCLQTDVITKHWESKSYNEDPNLIILEHHKKNNKFYGLASFKNSFYQQTWYIYAGKIYSLYQKGDIKIHWKLTYGIVHGYDDENGKHDGIINKLGTFPAILPTIGVNYKHLIVELLPLANEGFMITSGIRF